MIWSPEGRRHPPGRSPSEEAFRNGMIFLGTGGARVVVFKQIRASGGIWMELDGTQVHIDPGPGALVHARSKRLQLDPAHLTAVILTHKHLDHSADINVMIEAMTEGGFHPRGAVLAPKDAYDRDPVVLQYLRSYVGRVEVLEEGSRFQLETLFLKVSDRLVHSVENYALTFEGGGKTISLISDTRYFPGLEEPPRSEQPEDVLILNVVLHERREIDHLCLEDAKRIIGARKPRLSILTHFGMSMLRAKPWELAAGIEQEVGLRVVAAYDHMRLDLSSLDH